MIKRTFGDVKEELRRVAGQTGLVVDDDRLRIAVNLAQERLCTLGEWPYQYARIKFRQRGGVVALPTQYEAIVHSSINRQPVEVQPPWFEFLEHGPGPYQKNEWCNLGNLKQGAGMQPKTGNAPMPSASMAPGTAPLARGPSYASAKFPISYGPTR